MQLVNKKWLVIIAVGGLILAAIIFNFITIKNREQAKQDVYYDPYSKQTVLSPEGKTPEPSGAQAGFPLMLGIDSFTPLGLSSYQLEAFKIALNNFSKTLSPAGTEISIVVDSLNKAPHKSDDPNFVDVINFDLVVNRQNHYSARLEFYDLTTIRLLIYKHKTTDTLFDSGALDITGETDH